MDSCRCIKGITPTFWTSVNERSITNFKMTTAAKIKPQNPEPVMVVNEPLKDLIIWKSPARPFKKLNRDYYTTVGAIIFLLVVILLFLKEWLLIGVIVSLGFVKYVLSTVPPEEIEHKITTRGVVSGGQRWDWSLLSRFWFSEKWGNELLNIETRMGFPRRLMLLVGTADKKQLQTALEKYLTPEKPEKQFVDRAALWLQKKVPLETE